MSRPLEARAAARAAEPVPSVSGHALLSCIPGGSICLQARHPIRPLSLEGLLAVLADLADHYRMMARFFRPAGGQPRLASPSGFDRMSSRAFVSAMLSQSAFQGRLPGAHAHAQGPLFARCSSAPRPEPRMTAIRRFSSALRASPPPDSQHKARARHSQVARAGRQMPPAAFGL